MPDKKLTDSEIVKALECCQMNGLCEFCYLKSDKRGCQDRLHKDSLDLINRLQAENEKLQKFKSYYDFYYGCDLEILGVDENGNTTSFDEFYNCAIADAESIEHHIAHIIKTAKAEAYKEFAELLHCQCESIINQPHNENVRPISWKVAYVEFDEKIDNLLKEMVGDTNA